MPRRHQKQSSPELTANSPLPSQGSTTIRESVHIKGDIRGEEDLIIQGQVQGTVQLKNNHVVIGKTGQLTGDLYGKFISIEGQAQGNFFGGKKIELQPSAVVHADMKAPAISLPDGARFKGKIDMDPKEGERENPQ